MSGIYELSRDKSYRPASEQGAGNSIDFVADTPPKDTDPNPRPNETAYGYVPEGPVKINPEQLRAAIAQIANNVVIVRRGEMLPRQN